MIIDGKKISREVLESFKDEIQNKNLKLRLAVVLVSNNPGIKKFAELKSKAVKEIGAECVIFEFPETISEHLLTEKVREIVKDKANDGVLVELPLPKGIDIQNILNEIAPEKDVDVLSQKAQDNFFSNRSSMLPPAVEAVKTVLEFYNITIKNKKAAVFGYGLLVGKPVAHWLSQNGAEVSVIDEHTKEPQKYSLEADIVVSGVGKPRLITGEMVREGVIAIDFGYENKDGKMVGDFDFEEVSKKAKLITPVPGGIGPMVVSSVLKNLVRARS